MQIIYHFSQKVRTFVYSIMYLKKDLVYETLSQTRKIAEIEI